MDDMSFGNIYIDSQPVTLDWDTLVTDESEMEVDGIPSSLIDMWVRKKQLFPSYTKDNLRHFYTKDVLNACRSYVKVY